MGLMSGHITYFYEFGPFVLDAKERVLLEDDSPVQVPPKALDILFVLVEKHGHLVGKDELMKRVWPDSFVEEANLTQNISVLRKALSETPDQRFIETVPRRGYRFVAPVEEVDRTYTVEEITSASLVISTEDAGTVARADDAAGVELRQPLAIAGRVGSRLRPRFLILIVLLLAIPVSAYFLFHHPPQNVRSIAVLPLKVEDEEDQAFGVGITDSLIRQLGGSLKEISVRPIEEVSKYGQGNDRGATDAGRELKVDAVLEGTVKRSGDRAAVRVRLWRAENGSRIGREIKKETIVTDLLAAQDSIAEQVAHSLRIELTTEQMRRLERRPTDDSVALERCLVGRYFWSKLNFADALNMFGEAAQRDSAYAAPRAGIAECYAALGSTGYDLAPEETLLKAYDYALKAKDLDPDLPEAHASLGIVHLLYDWDLDEAEAELKRARELNPSCQSAQFWYTVYLTAAVRSEESISEARKAQQADPTSSLMSVAVARALYYAGKYDEAAQQAQKIPGPNGHYILANCYEQKGKFLEAIEEFKQVAKDGESASIWLAALGAAYAMAGKSKEAMAILAQLSERSKSKYVSPTYEATIYAALGDRNKAFELLDKAFRQHDSSIVSLKIEPTLANLRDDPRFGELVERIKANPALRR
jgi:DNA-binding winged helix-turn-helix (wHTH) protein/TolB-like protein